MSSLGPTKNNAETRPSNASTKWRFRLFLLSGLVASGWAFSSTASVSETGSPLALESVRSPLACPGLSFELAPMLGRNEEFRSSASDAISINGGRLDSVLPPPSRRESGGNPERADFDSNAKVHILRSSPDLWGRWSPTRAIAAAERYGHWSTGRHHLYPTTDIPAKRLPDGMGEAAVDLATRVILPSIAFAFGVPLEKLYFKDLFLAKYEPTGQPGLGKHTDGSAYSFNMLLSDPAADFDGGGTWIEPVGLVAPRRGDVLMHRGNLLHEGCPVSKGVRYVLVGFVQSDSGRGRNGNSKLLLKTVETFPLGMVIEVDEGDETSCAMIADVVTNGPASRAGIQKHDCIRGLLLPKNLLGNKHEFVEFDGKGFDAVMEHIAAMKGRGEVRMVVERWCSE